MGSSHRESSQDCAVMCSREVACLPGEMELPLGWCSERATTLLAKFDRSASSVTGHDAAHAVSGVLCAPVLHATTFRAGKVRFTDEVPRRLIPPGWVNLGYKLHAKGWGDASEAGTVSPRPRPKGCQQRQSRGLRWRQVANACSERQNLRVPPGPLRFMGPVSPVINATQWPDGTSSRQFAGLLSNSPQQPESGPAAIRLR